MKNNPLYEKMRNGEKVLGAFFNLNCVPGVEILAQSGLDFIMFDTEHGPCDVETMSSLVIACEARDITPIIRVKDYQRNSVLKMLDIGAMGVLVPFIKTVDEVKQLVSYGKYRPVGDRGYGMTRKNCYCLDPITKRAEDYFEWANRETMIIPQCETKEALGCIEEIAAVEGVDGIFVGPFDLSVSMGIPTQFKNPVFIDALKRVLKACRDNGKFCWILSLAPEDGIEKLEMGFDGVLGMDSMFLIEGARRYVSTVRGAGKQR